MDKELNNIIKEIQNRDGVIVKDLPQKNIIAENNTFFQKDDNGNYYPVKKIDGELRYMYVDGNNKVYWK